jgi:predicted DCC family thiol-disulfide oxidoreductase YuxK
MTSKSLKITKAEQPQPTLIFFDGDCVTCHGAVMFLMKRKAREQFRFISLETLRGTSWQQRIADQLGMDLGTSIVVAKSGQLYARSEALFCLISDLGWPWRLLLIGRVVPTFLLDAAYDAFATVRYKIFGKAPLASFCEPLPPELRRLVLSEVPSDDHAH